MKQLSRLLLWTAFVFLPLFIVDLTMSIRFQRPIAPAPHDAVDEDNGTRTTFTTLHETDSTAAGTAWCVLDSENTVYKYFRHFPHTLESLAPCWSYFSRAREQDPSLGCGIFLNSSLLDWEDVRPWSKSLVKAMNCSVTSKEPDDSFIEFHKPPLPRGYFQRRQDLKQLQDLVLSASSPTRQVMPPSATKHVRIGLVQRVKKGIGNCRMILNLAEIRMALQAELPLSAQIEETNLENFTLTQQATWFNRQDVVVAAHGAAMTNTMFMKEHSAAIEIFPQEYHTYLFRELMESCGVTPYELISDGIRIPTRRPEHPRNVDLRPNVTVLVELVHHALETRRQTILMGLNLFLMLARSLVAGCQSER